jgi:hypothetical protein
MTTLIDAISPAPAHPAAAWKKGFLDHATEVDATGFPIRGSFGVNYDCRVDLNTSTERTELIASISATQPTFTPRQITYAVDQLTAIYASLQPGTTIAFKQGMKAIAFVRIVSPYSYKEGHVSGFPHRWDYEVICKANPELHGNGRVTYVPKAVALPLAPLPPPPAEEVAAPPVPDLEAETAALRAENAALKAELEDLRSRYKARDAAIVMLVMSAP